MHSHNHTSRRAVPWERVLLIAVSCLFVAYYFTHSNNTAEIVALINAHCNGEKGGSEKKLHRPFQRSLDANANGAAEQHRNLNTANIGAIPLLGIGAVPNQNAVNAGPLPKPPGLESPHAAAAADNTVNAAPPVTVKRGQLMWNRPVPAASGVAPQTVAPGAPTQRAYGRPVTSAPTEIQYLPDPNETPAPFKIDSATSSSVNSVVAEYAVNRHDDPDVAYATEHPIHREPYPDRAQLIDGLYGAEGSTDPFTTIPNDPRFKGAPYVSTVQIAHKQIMATVQRELRGPPKFAMEVGSFVGSGIVHCWAPLIEKHHSGTSQLLSIDTWQGDVNMRVLGAPFQNTMRYVNGHPSFDETLRYRIRANGFEKHVAMLHMPSLLGARFVQARGWRPDFIFIDTAHEIGETFAEMTLYFNLLRPGGLMSGDDYTPHSKNSFTGVKHDVDLFAAYYGLEKFIEGVMWYIRKPKNFTDTAAALEDRRGQDLDKMMAKMWSAHRDPVRTNPFSRERFHPYRMQWGKAFFTPSLFAVMSLVHYYAPAMGPPVEMKGGKLPPAPPLSKSPNYRKVESVNALGAVYSLAVKSAPQPPALSTEEIVTKFAPPALNAAAVTRFIDNYFASSDGSARPQDSHASLSFILQVGAGLGHSTVQVLAPLAAKHSGIVLAVDTFHGTVGQRLRMGGKYKGLFELENDFRPTLYKNFLRHVNAAGFADVVVPFAMGTVVGGRLVHSARWLCGIVWLESSGERGETYAELASTTAGLAPGGLLMGRLPMGRGNATIAGATADIELFLRHRGYPSMKAVPKADGVWYSVRPMRHEEDLQREVSGAMAFEA